MNVIKRIAAWFSKPKEGELIKKGNFRDLCKLPTDKNGIPDIPRDWMLQDEKFKAFYERISGISVEEAISREDSRK